MTSALLVNAGSQHRYTKLAGKTTITFMAKSLLKLGQEMALNDTTRPTIGLDVGNGAEKLYSGLGQILPESYILSIEERAMFANQGSGIYGISGGRSF